MVDIQSKEVIDKMSEELKVQPSMALPRKLNDSIQPVYDVTPDPKATLRESSLRTTSISAGALITLPAGKDFFLTEAEIHSSSTVTCDNVAIDMTATDINGKSIVIASLSKIILTATSDGVVVQYNPPLKLQRGSAILRTNAFTLGSSKTVFGITGYTTDPQ